MKINFTKKEYRSLLEIINVADWVMHCHETENKDNEYKQLMKRIRSFCKEMEALDCLEYDEELDDYFESNDFEGSCGRTPKNVSLKLLNTSK